MCLLGARSAETKLHEKTKYRQLFGRPIVFAQAKNTPYRLSSITPRHLNWGRQLWVKAAATCCIRADSSSKPGSDGNAPACWRRHGKPISFQGPRPVKFRSRVQPTKSACAGIISSAGGMLPHAGHQCSCHGHANHPSWIENNISRFRITFPEPPDLQRSGNNSVLGVLVSPALILGAGHNTVNRGARATMRRRSSGTHIGHACRHLVQVSEGCHLWQRPAQLSTDHC